MSTKVKVSAIIPAYNEAERIEKAVMAVVKTLEELGYEYEVIIAEDGSTDGTDIIAARLEAENERVVHLHSDERLGRGRALARAFEAASYPIVMYLDADLSMDLKHLRDLVEAINSGFQIAIASRLLKESKTQRPFTREIPSRIYNLLVRVILGSKVKDHQCGFKAFNRDAVLDVIREVRDNHWFWDTELLVLAQRRGLSIKEIPVSWKQGEDTKVSVGRDSIYMLKRILELWLRK